MKDDKMILYVQMSNAPERQYSPLVLARSAKAMGQNPVLYYLGMGLTMLQPGALEHGPARQLPKCRRDDGRCAGGRNPGLRM